MNEASVARETMTLASISSFNNNSARTGETNVRRSRSIQWIRNHEKRMNVLQTWIYFRQCKALHTLGCLYILYCLGKWLIVSGGIPKGFPFFPRPIPPRPRKKKKKKKSNLKKRFDELTRADNEDIFFFLILYLKPIRGAA